MSSDVEAIKKLKEKFEILFRNLESAKAFAKTSHQTDLFQVCEMLMGTEEGFQFLYSKAHLFDSAGVFDGGPWANPRSLQPALVAGCLKIGGITPVVECLSDLRMLTISRGKDSPLIEKEAATNFIHEAMALNLDLVFPDEAMEYQTFSGPHFEMSVRLFSLMSAKTGLDQLYKNTLLEIEQLSAQRPITVDHIKKIVKLGSRMPLETQNTQMRNRFKMFTDALFGASPMSLKSENPEQYRKNIGKCDQKSLEKEAGNFSGCMLKTGLTSPLHADLLRHLQAKNPDLIPAALGLKELGTAEFFKNRKLVLQLIRASIFPATANSIYGLNKILEGGILSRNEVSVGLDRLMTLELQSRVKHDLLTKRKTRDAITANSLLVAGAISVFGQPLGVGQGNNPTCQTARAISLWAQHAHGYLLEILISAARDGFVSMAFEGNILRSDKLTGGLVKTLDLNLDPVSIVLTPHLDVIYDSMMKLVTLRTEDGHKWVNPALYGRWVPGGFTSVFADRLQTTISEYEGFIRRFFATHHPAYNDGHTLMYPNPVGIIVTNNLGEYLGPHAISIQRVAEDPKGILRAYFYNPNNEGRQKWGFGIEPSVESNGEREGESSLPFVDFATRLYAFHFNPYEEGDTFAVPAEIIKEIEEGARNSWGKRFTWTN